MKLRTTAIGLALAMCASSSMAALTCTSMSDWGNLGPPGAEIFGNSFGSSGTYSDCYNFSLSGPANSFGGVLEIDPFLNRLDIDVTRVSLFLGDSLIGFDATPLLFSFGGLAGGGTYTLAVESVVGNTSGWINKNVGYAGLITSVIDRNAVPEPGSLALLGLGLAGLVLARRRKS